MTENLRVKALELAVTWGLDFTPEETVEVADTFLRFLEDKTEVEYAAGSYVLLDWDDTPVGYIVVKDGGEARAFTTPNGVWVRTFDGSHIQEFLDEGIGHKAQRLGFNLVPRLRELNLLLQED